MDPPLPSCFNFSMKKILIILTFVPFSIFSLEKEKIEFTAGYFGEQYTHPGVIFGGEYPLKKGDNLDLFTSLNLGGYYHFRNHTGLFINSDIGFRKKFKNHFNIETSIGVGYLHKFIDGDIYTIEEDELKKKADYGRSKFMPGISIGVGYDLKEISGKPVTIYSKTALFGEYPLDSFLLPHITLIIGVKMKELLQ